MLSRTRSTIFAALLATASPLLAQTGGTPQLDVEEVTVIGRRVVILPSARKGEVVDTTIYELPPGDSLLFGARISNLGGTGGPLPGYRELESPAVMSVEGSLGSFFSPRARAHGEFIRKAFDISGTIDYRGTAGHIDSAEAGSLLLAAATSLVIEGDAFVPRQRLGGNAEYMSESYYLFGNPVTPFDRSRRGLRAGAGIRSEEDRSTNYAFDLDFTSISVEDRLAVDSIGGRAGTAGATSPRIAFQLGGTIAPFDLLLRTSYMATSLVYGAPTRSPSHFSGSLDGRYRFSPKLSMNAGIFYQAAGQSDTVGGSTTASMINLRAALRYDLDSALSINVAYTPELRAPSYRELIMAAPYVEREIVLRPEKVPLNFTAGIRYAIPGITFEAGGYMEQRENTPAVVLTSDSALRYDRFESRSAGISGSARIETIAPFAFLLEGRAGSSVDEATDETLPLHPLIDVRGNIGYALGASIDLFADLRFQSARPVRLVDTAAAAVTRDLPAHLLVDIGGRWAVLPKLDIVASVTNLLGTAWEKFPGYSAPGLEVRAGARLEF
jgi:hypothetical protein